MKKEIKIKTVLLLILFLAFICIYIICISFLNYISDDKDICLDTGICKEGLTLNIENNQITVNEKTCTNNKGKWIDKDKICIFK